MDNGCYGYVKGSVHMERNMFAYTLYIHFKIEFLLYFNENNGCRRFYLNVISELGLV